MTKIEATVVEQVVIETAEHQDFELSVAELDMVGGGVLCTNL